MNFLEPKGKRLHSDLWGSLIHITAQAIISLDTLARTVNWYWWKCFTLVLLQLLPPHPEEVTASLQGLEMVSISLVLWFSVRFVLVSPKNTTITWHNRTHICTPHSHHWITSSLLPPQLSPPLVFFFLNCKTIHTSYSREQPKQPTHICTRFKFFGRLCCSSFPFIYPKWHKQKMLKKTTEWLRRGKEWSFHKERILLSHNLVSFLCLHNTTGTVEHITYWQINRTSYLDFILSCILPCWIHCWSNSSFRFCIFSNLPWRYSFSWLSWLTSDLQK